MTDVTPPDPRRVVWPAAYYSTPTPQAILPRGLSYGCGAASIVVLLIVFAGGAFVSTGGIADFMDFVLGMSFSELKYDAGVSAQQKKELTAEVETLREGIRTKKVPVAKLQPFLQSLQRASADGTVNGAEAEQLENAAHAINTARR